MKKLLISLVSGATIALALPAIAFAHVVVTPKQAAVGESVRFSVSVPNEKQVDVSSVKITVPDGLQDVQPDVMAGWQIATTTDGSGAVSSITWTGDIPVGQRADLAFKAEAPAKAGNLDWKAYQTYADGSVVSWDQKPVANEKDDDSSATGPYSITSVVNDLGSDSSTSPSGDSDKATLALILSIVALLLSIGALFLRRKK